MLVSIMSPIAKVERWSMVASWIFEEDQSSNSTFLHTEVRTERTAVSGLLGSDSSSMDMLGEHLRLILSGTAVSDAVLSKGSESISMCGAGEIAIF